MSYQRESIVQPYGKLEFLAHDISGNIDPRGFNFVGDRVSSYGVINFGYVKGGSSKRIKPIDYGIERDIWLRSIWAFNTSATNDEITMRLYAGRAEFFEQKISNNEMPYTFPPGAILNPNLIFEVQPKYDATQVVLYWQPVHVLSYVEI